MRIVDAQIHLWGSGLPSNMAHRQVTSFATEEAVGLMDEGGVDAAVIHPPGWDPNATEMAFKAVRDFPGRFAILGAFPLSQPDKRALVETWRSQPGMLAMEHRGPLRKRHGFPHFNSFARAGEFLSRFDETSSRSRLAGSMRATERDRAPNHGEPRLRV